MPFTETNLTAQKRSFLKLASLSALLFSAVLLSGCKDAKTPAATEVGSTPAATIVGDKIIIGEYGSKTGAQADFGIQTDNGIRLAIEEVNKAGGIERDGKKYQVDLPDTEDDASKAEQAETAVKRLVDKNVVAVLGEVASSASIAGGKVCEEKGIPMITPSSTRVDVTTGKQYLFRVCFLDSYQAAVVARFSIDGLKAKKVALFVNKSQSYSTGFAEEFKKALVKYGGTILGEKNYSDKDQDFRSQLTSIKALNPDAILIPGYYSDVSQIAGQARELGITIPLLGGDGWSSPELLTKGGKAVENTYFSDHMAVDDPKPVVKNFVKNYQDKYKVAPSSMSALGYDAAKILCNALKTAKTLDKKDIRDAIASTSNYDGTSGNISINKEHNADKSAVIIKVKDGKFVYAATIPDPEKPMTK